MAVGPGRPAMRLLVSSMSAGGRALRVGPSVVAALRGGGWDVEVVVTTAGDDPASMVAPGADAVGEGLNPALGLDAAADARTRDSTWSAVQQALQRFDVEDVQRLRDFDPDAIPETPLLHVANNILLVKEDTVVSQRYLDDARRWYAAEVGRAPNDDAKAALDAWASLHTGGLIKKSGIDVTPGMRLVLQNALLFAARWAAPFTAEHTAKGSPFTLSDGSASTADLMTGTGTYALAQGQGWRALRLPYTAGATTPGAPVPSPSGSGTTDSGELVMDVILPDDVVSPADMPPRRRRPSRRRGLGRRSPSSCRSSTWRPESWTSSPSCSRWA